MNILTFKCKVYGTDVKRLNGFEDIFTLKSGRIIECAQCKTLYQVPKIYWFVGKIYDLLTLWGFISFWIIVFLLNELHFNLGGEIYLYAAIIYISLEFIVMTILPIRKIKDNE